jgi:hypothetical protein
MYRNGILCGRGVAREVTIAVASREDAVGRVAPSRDAVAPLVPGSCREADGPYTGCRGVCTRRSGFLCTLGRHAGWLCDPVGRRCDPSGRSAVLRDAWIPWTPGSCREAGRHPGSCLEAAQDAWRPYRMAWRPHRLCLWLHIPKRDTLHSEVHQYASGLADVTESVGDVFRGGHRHTRAVHDPRR